MINPPAPKSFKDFKDSKTKPIGVKEFQSDLDKSKLANDYNDHERYRDLKYKLINFVSTWGVGILIVSWVLLSVAVNFFSWLTELKQGIELALGTLATLYVGSLISNDFKLKS